MKKEILEKKIKLNSSGMAKLDSLFKIINHLDIAIDACDEMQDVWSKLEISEHLDAAQQEANEQAVRLIKVGLK